MITGGKIGALIGRKRAFAIGCVIYGCGSFTTALAPNLPVLLFGWSFLEGVGAALILPAIVALVAGELPDRAAARRLRAGRGRGRDRRRGRPADRRLLHDLLLLALGLRRRGRGRARDPAARAPDRRRARARRARSSTWSARCSRRPGSRCSSSACCARASGAGSSRRPGGPSWAGLSPTVWLVLGGPVRDLALLPLGAPPRGAGQGAARSGPAMLRNTQLTGGLTMFFFQYLVQAGFFFVVPLYLSVCLGLSALETGARLLPLSVTLLAAAIGIPRFFPHVSPRLVVRLRPARAARRDGRPARRARRGRRRRRSSSCRCS